MTDDIAPFGSLDDLPESTDVASRAPRLVLIVVALLVAAVLAVVVVVFAVGTVAHVIEVGRTPVVADLATVEQNTGLDLPEGTTLAEFRRAEAEASAAVTGTERIVWLGLGLVEDDDTDGGQSDPRRWATDPGRARDRPVPAGDGGHAVTERLRGLLRTVTGPAEAAAPTADADLLEAASADELFDLIHKEFGKS